MHFLKIRDASSEDLEACRQTLEMSESSYYIVIINEA